MGALSSCRLALSQKHLHEFWQRWIGNDRVSGGVSAAKYGYLLDRKDSPHV